MTRKMEKNKNNNSSPGFNLVSQCDIFKKFVLQASPRKNI